NRVFRSHRWLAVSTALLLAALIGGPAAAETTTEGAPSAQYVHEVDQYQHLGGATYRVYGYQEGLVGSTTANGHVIQPNDHFVALPCFCVLSSRGGNEFQVKLEYKGKTVIVPVWDVGPWNVDDNYWDPSSKRKYSSLPQGYPEAAAAFYADFNGGKDGWGRTVGSPGGIDIGDGAFAELGMPGSDWVNVTFLWLEPDHWDLPAPAAGFGDVTTVWWDQRPPLDWTAPKNDGRFAWFDVTGHNVPNQLNDYWWGNGGWRLFGLPISEFFREVDIDGTIRYVQYFERSILALDPATGAVSRTPVGDRSHMDYKASLPIDPFQNTSSAIYFPDTQHSVQNGFKWYWEHNGGQAAFGAPISEEWSETNADGRKVVMQMFEYARFEWWPDKVGTDEEITRGLLTVELIDDLGWSR
ncbi:MAG TPA: hypothetical protein PK593_05560, partial [Thermomicrobiales bacterium]|nr:hypothetical protein [Thermomicrobiales bacterium]